MVANSRDQHKAWAAAKGRQSSARLAYSFRNHIVVTNFARLPKKSTLLSEENPSLISTQSSFLP